jgi:hypothetical protein
LRTFLLNPRIAFNTMGYGYRHPVIGYEKTSILWLIRSGRMFPSFPIAASQNTILFTRCSSFLFERASSFWLTPEEKGAAAESTDRAPGFAWLNPSSRHRLGSPPESYSMRYRHKCQLKSGSR